MLEVIVEHIVVLVIAGTHCFITMMSDHSARMTQGTTVTLDHISTTMTYVMRHEEHLLNVSVLHRIHLSHLVFLDLLCLSVKWGNFNKGIITVAVISQKLEDMEMLNLC
jgi:hypothetical protein